MSTQVKERLIQRTRRERRRLRDTRCTCKLEPVNEKAGRVKYRFLRILYSEDCPLAHEPSLFHGLPYLVEVHKRWPEEVGRHTQAV